MNKKGFRFRLKENKKIVCSQMEIAKMTLMTYIKFQSKTNLPSTYVEGRILLFNFVRRHLQESYGTESKIVGRRFCSEIFGGFSPWHLRRCHTEKSENKFWPSFITNQTSSQLLFVRINYCINATAKGHNDRRSKIGQGFKQNRRGGGGQRNNRLNAEEENF